jgi:hypothetical protein
LDADFLGLIFMVQQIRALKLLEQLIGEWVVGIAMKTSSGKLISGCGTMTAKEMRSPLGISSEMGIHIDGEDDYFESDIWSFDQAAGKMHLFSVTSHGDAHDHMGDWIDEKLLNSAGRAAIKKRIWKKK